MAGEPHLAGTERVREQVQRVLLGELEVTSGYLTAGIELHEVASYLSDAATRSMKTTAYFWVVVVWGGVHRLGNARGIWHRRDGHIGRLSLDEQRATGENQPMHPRIRSSFWG